MLWLDVEVHHKWLGNKLKYHVPQVNTARNILEWFRDTAKHVTEVESVDIEDLDNNSVCKSVCANSMYSITQTILLSYQDTSTAELSQEGVDYLHSLTEEFGCSMDTLLPFLYSPLMTFDFYDLGQVGETSTQIVWVMRYIVLAQIELKKGSSFEPSISKPSTSMTMFLANLTKLLENFNGFEGVGKYDSHHVPQLNEKEYLDCWSLPLVTLTAIAVSLHKVPSNIVYRLLSSVSEGLVYVTHVEETLNATDEYAIIQKAARTLWLEVEVNHKWFSNKLRKHALKNSEDDCRNMQDDSTDSEFHRDLCLVLYMMLELDKGYVLCLKCSGGNVDQTAKLGSMAFMCTMMANFLPSLATMNGKELVTNILALGILVTTLVVNVCIQIKTGVVSYSEAEHFNETVADVKRQSPYIFVYINRNRSIAIIYVAIVLVLLIIQTCSALIVLRSKQILELKYQAGHKTALNEQELQQPKRLTVEKLKLHVKNYWIMAGNSSQLAPQRAPLMGDIPKDLISSLSSYTLSIYRSDQDNRYFTLNAASLSVISVAMKIHMDLNNSMPAKLLGLAPEYQEAVKECYKEFIGMVKIYYEEANRSKQERPGKEVVENDRGTVGLKEPQAFAGINAEIGNSLNGTPKGTAEVDAKNKGNSEETTNKDLEDYTSSSDDFIVNT
nr:hypothetical protein CTI12_AA420450 [Tanacetum cinerariifolium]